MSLPPANATRTVNRIDFLEGLRGYLAVYVMFAHVGFFVGICRIVKSDVLFPGALPVVLNYFNLSGWDAVNMFMILSGFVIFHLLSKGRETYLAYIIRRFFRLWPIFILAMILGTLINGLYVYSLANNPWAPHNSWIIEQWENAVAVQKNMLPYFLWDLPMLHGIVPAFVLDRASSAFSSLAWCISTEWQFYIFAPLFYRLMKTTAGAVGVTAFVIFSLGWEHVFDFSVNPAHSLLPLQLHWFFIGMICYLAYQDIEANGLTSRNKLKIAFVVAFVIGLSVFNPRLAPAAVAWLFVVVTLVASLTHKPNFISRMVTGFFDHKITRYFGRISYPVYLVHWPVSLVVLWLLVRFYPQSSWQTAYLILMLSVPAITWPVAHLAHHFLEKPMMEFGKRFAAKFPRRATAIIAPASAPAQPVAGNTNQPA